MFTICAGYNNETWTMRQKELTMNQFMVILIFVDLFAKFSQVKKRKHVIDHVAQINSIDLGSDWP